jgi:cation/acetate symporter
MLGNRRMINPLLGVYYGIFTAGYIGLGVLLLILEYMGVIEGHISYAMTAVAFVLAGIIALAATTVTSDDFFTSGRRVPAGLNGLVILVVTFGGVGLSAVLATLFFLGIDGYGMMLGMLGGVMLSGVLAAAFIRKAGAYTLASFFEIRYNSRFAGVLAGLALLLPVALLALAELTLLTKAPHWRQSHYPPHPAPNS